MGSGRGKACQATSETEYPQTVHRESVLDTLPKEIPADLTTRVRQLIECRLEAIVRSVGMPDLLARLVPGKMLRSRLAGRLSRSGVTLTNIATLGYVCAATEMVHTASLLHDDVIDGGLIRRAHPALWRATGPSAAVLLGDMLLCDAMMLLQKALGGRYVETFVEKVREMCQFEAEQELVYRGKRLDESTCLRLARGKTGPLFAFIGRVCGGGDSALASALEEAGYHLGTAYQVADDLLDVVGDEQLAKKTLGTDMTRSKFTLAVVQHHETGRAHHWVSALCASALECVNRWPRVREAMSAFLFYDLQTVFKRCALDLNVCGKPQP